MAKKGDKKKGKTKGADEATPELTESILSDGSVSFVLEPGVEHEQESEQQSNLTTSFTSQVDPITNNLNLPEKTQEIYELPDLSDIIVKRYEGEKCKDRFHGEGVAHFQGGHVYKGMFSGGLMHGRGVYTWANGVKYEGEFVSNVPMGHGKYTWLDGSTYEGEVFNAIQHGIGTHKCASVMFRGTWHRGKRHGKGTIHYNQDATSWFDGDWVHNNIEGWGVRRYPSGNLYEGEWKNNQRHGEGTMKWLHLKQEYSGTWHNGVQHGKGTHTWFLKRKPGSQYPQRNQYRGDFVQGQRHGCGTFHYAGGALYQGGWKHNKKHGQGKFIFKNGRVFEGQFVDDHMAEFPSFCLDGSKTPNLSGIRTHTPLPEDRICPRRLGSDSDSVVLGPDVALDIGSLLEKVPSSQRDVECKQVEYVVLRHISELRSIYSFYSSLGHPRSPDNTFLLSRLQFWRLLKDCYIHHHDMTLAHVDRLIREEVPPEEEVHSPFTAMLLRTFISCVVVLAYHMFHEDIQSSNSVLVACFSKLMNDNILPNAKNVKGLLFSNPVHAVVTVNYTEKCWEIYQAFSVVKPASSADRTMTCRHLVWMFKDLGLFDGKLTTGKLLKIMSAENIDTRDWSCYNLDLEITFLEFLEALLACAEVKSQLIGQDRQQQPCSDIEAKQATARVKSSIFPDIASSKSVETARSRDILQLSSSEYMESQHNLSPVATSQTAVMATDSATQLSEVHKKEETSLQELLAAHSTERAGEEVKVIGVGGPEAHADEMDQWIQRTHQFFSQLFFPAYDYSGLLNREVEEERLRQEAQRRIGLAKVLEQTRLREWKELEERRQKEEETAAEKADGQDEVNSSSVAQSPIASQSLLQPKPSAGTGPRRKK